MTVVLFATSLNFLLQVYFSLLNDPLAAGTDVFLQDWNGLQACAFPPFALVRQVLTKLHSCKGMELALITPFWPSETVVPGPSESIDSSNCCPVQKGGSTQIAPLPPSAPTSPCASASCLETLQ